jgi:hypothetical protein
MIMKPNRLYSHGAHAKTREAGVTLLDVVLAIAVFAFGMLALVQLQGSLTRSSADANTRTVAANIAEELAESLRAYRAIQADPDNGLWDYLEMDSDTLDIDNLERGGVEYDIDATVSHFWWDEGNETFVRTETADAPDGLETLAYADFKLLRLDVSWDDRENYVDDANTADLGTGVITVYEIVPSSPPALGARLAASLDDDSGILVTYNPGDNPDIIPLQLDDQGTRFKESTSAHPTLFHDDYVETWFDVVTYSKVQLYDEDGNLIGEDNPFVRREEFVNVACKCELNESPAAADYGLTPTLWDGVSYSEGQQIEKPTGTPVQNVQQSNFCGVCCRDHHDVANGGAEEIYNPDKVVGGGNHYHYDRDNRGTLDLTPVSDGDTYVEACRLVRHNGFMRVTRDVSQKTLIGFPEGYLDLDDGAAVYSAYVIDAVEDYYGINDQSAFPQPNPPQDGGAVFPARTDLTPTNLPTATFQTEQQLRARSLYADYLTDAAKAVITDCFDSDPPASDCAAPNAVSELEIYPFFDLQMTHLASWADEGATGLIISTGPQQRLNQAVVSDDPATIGPEYDRGVAELASSEIGGLVDVSIRSTNGNTGLTATAPIDDIELETREDLYIATNDDDSPVPPIGVLVSGELSSGVRRVLPADLSFIAEGAICGTTPTHWSCVVPLAGATLEITGYFLNNPRVYVCSDLPGRAESADQRSTSFTLPTVATTANIWVTDDFALCPGG